MIRALPFHTPLALALPRVAALAPHGSPFVPCTPARSRAAVLHLALVVRAAPCLTIGQCAALAANGLGRRCALSGNGVVRGRRGQQQLEFASVTSCRCKHWGW